MKYLGCAYYPETWDVKRVAVDAALMQEAGINLVRIGEFAWSTIEPKENMFKLDWLHKSIEILASHNISVLMCTPTAAPPAWLTHNYPETMAKDKHLHPFGHGRRHHGCYTSAKFREFCGKVTEKMTRDLACHDNIIAWQIENELGCSGFGICECDNCQNGFRKWLKHRYGSIAELNQRWGNELWSQDYTDWKEIHIGKLQDNLPPSRVLDSTRFHAEMILSFAAEQVKLVRENNPKWIVTTNNPSRIDYFKLFESLDVAGADLYFDGKKTAECTFSMDLYRSFKKEKPFWLVETGIRDNPLELKMFRANFWSTFAHGAEMFLYFRWRYPGSGQEQSQLGVLTHSGAARHQYQLIKKTFNEFWKMQEHFKNLPLPKGKVAIVFDIQAIWMCGSGRMAKSFRGMGVMNDCYKSLLKRGILTDFIPTNVDIASYRVLILTVQMNLSQDFLEKIEKFVEDGGVVLSIGPLGIFDENANYLAEPHINIISKIFGVKSYDGSLISAKDGEAAITISGVLDKSTISGKVARWIGDIDLEGAEALLKFDAGVYKDQPVLSVRSLAKGKAVYFASTYCDAELFEKIMAYVLKLAEFTDTEELPAEVEVIRRGEMIFLINRDKCTKRVKLRYPAIAIMGNCNDGFVDLQPYDVAIIQEQMKQTVKRGTK